MHQPAPPEEPQVPSYATLPLRRRSSEARTWAFSSRKKLTAGSVQLPQQVLVIDTGVRTIAEHFAARQKMDAATRAQFEMEIRQWAVPGWALQHEAMLESGTVRPSGTADEGLLLETSKAVFDGSRFRDLAPGLGLLQRSAVFRVLLLVGLADGYDSARDCLCLHPADGRLAIIDGLADLDQVLSDDEPARQVFVAGTSAVMWGVAVAMAQGLLQGFAGDKLDSGRPAPTFLPKPVPLACHVLSRGDFDGQFPKALFDRVPSVSSVDVTTLRDEKLQTLLNRAGPSVHSSNLAAYVFLVAAPASAAKLLADIAAAHGGITTSTPAPSYDFMRPLGRPTMGPTCRR